MSTLAWHRLGTGTYEARTGNGERDRYLAERIDQEPSYGYGSGPAWVLTYPGEVRPDSVGRTLGQCKVWALAHNKSL